jgi:putative restriction endonuclease
MMEGNLLYMRSANAHPIFRVELEQAAYNHGFRKAMGVADGWLWFRSDEGVPGEVALASGTLSDGSPWFLAVQHVGVAAKLRDELTLAMVSPPPDHFPAAFAFSTQSELRAALSRAFHLARSLPAFPHMQFEAELSRLGGTEVERLGNERVGQAFFRRALLDYWGECCPLTGIRDEALLRASHIVPWAECRTDEERLDVFNGLLLSVHWDAAFDRGLVSFDNEGRVLVAPSLSAKAVELLAPDTVGVIPLDEAHRIRLSWHRQHFGFA